MYEARVVRNFTFEKFKSHGEFKKGETIKDLTKADVDYLGGNNTYHTKFIDNVKEIVETSVNPEEVETATKKTTTRKPTSKKK